MIVFELCPKALWCHIFLFNWPKFTKLLHYLIILVYVFIFKLVKLKIDKKKKGKWCHFNFNAFAYKHITYNKTTKDLHVTAFFL